MSADRYWVTVRQVCTDKQIRILELRELHGFSLRVIALMTGSSLSTVRGHLDAGHRRIDNAFREESRA